MTLAELKKDFPQVAMILQLTEDPIIDCNLFVLNEDSQLLQPRQSRALTAWVVGKGRDSRNIIKVHKAGGWLSPGTLLDSAKPLFKIGFLVVTVKVPNGITVNVYHSESGDVRDILFKAFADRVMPHKRKSQKK